MTDAPISEAPAPARKEPPPPLTARAPRPKAIRLRKSAVQLAFAGAAVMLSGSLAYAFIIKPELRAEAKARAAEERDPGAAGSVRAGEAITAQPASYDRLAALDAPPELPEPRFGGERTEAESEIETPAPPRAYARVSEPRYEPPVSYGPPQPSLVDQRRTAARARAEQAAGSGLFLADATRAPTGSNTIAASADRSAPITLRQDYAAVYGGHALLEPLSPYELKAGAFIPGALITAVDTSRPGPVLASVTGNVFDTVTGRTLLVPQGSKLIGRYGGDSQYGDKRAFLVWDRLILPNGKSLILSEQPGVDVRGAMGLRGRADRRLLQLGVATLIGAAVTTLGEIARDSGERDRSLLGDAGDAASIQGAQVAGRLVDRELDVRPSIHVRAGSPVRVLITRDLILEPYRP